MYFNDLLLSTVNTIKKAICGFDEFGLKFTQKHLDLMFPKILSLSIEEQAQYADFVCVSNINESWFIDMCRDTELDEYSIKTINTTAIGNLAYVALNINDEASKVRAILNLQKIQEYYNNNK